MLTSLKFNIANAPIRRQTLHGRKYVVAPMAMLTEGVHNGSGGALLYRESECKKAVPAWNMKPIVVYHPAINGQGVSACDPDILERQQVGMVMKAVWNGKLRAEAWIEEDRANVVDDRIVDALDNNKMMEVSTGLFTENTGEPGVWNGEEYIAEATNHQPDHLALLPDQIGACSIADGAGLLQMNEAAQTTGIDITPLLVREMDMLRRMVGNAMSHSDTYAALQKALKARLGVADCWIIDVYDKYFVYDLGDGKKMFKLPYTGGKQGIEITGDPEEVMRVTEYKPVANAAPGQSRDKDEQPTGNEAQTNQEVHDMGKKELVDALIANASAIWNEDDRDTLMGMDDETLATLNGKMGGGKYKKKAADDAEADDDKEKKPMENAAPAPVELTTEQYIAQAPEEIRDVLNNGLAAHNATKAELIGKITANAANKFSAEFLATKSLGELQGIAALATQPAAPTENTHRQVPMFAGQATPAAAPIANAADDDDVLVMPTMNFEATAN